MRINLPTQSIIYAYPEISYINQEGQPFALYMRVEDCIQDIQQLDCAVYQQIR